MGSCRTASPRLTALRNKKTLPASYGEGRHRIPELRTRRSIGQDVHVTIIDDRVVVIGVARGAVDQPEVAAELDRVVDEHVVRRLVDVDAAEGIADGDRTALVGADLVDVDEVAGRVRREDLDADGVS